MTNRIKKNHYPWRTTSDIDVLVDGETFFTAMLKSIKEAETQILFESYLFESGLTATSFIDELISAKNRGVEVLVLLDDYGSKGLNSVDKKKLLDANISLSLYHPTNIFNFSYSLKRDHRKLLTVDNIIAFIGGAGITDEFNSKLHKHYWHDVMIRMRGDIVHDLNDSFMKIWNTIDLDIKEKISSNSNTHKLIKHNKNIARVLISAGTNKNEINRALIKHVRKSKKRVWLTSPYFVSSWKLRRALLFAANKGVDVRLIFPGPHSDHNWISNAVRRYYQRLLKAGITIYEYQPRFVHSKIIICDDWFTIGSSNLDRWNQFLNLDINIEAYHEHAYKKITDVFEIDFSNSNKIRLQQWVSRSNIQRIREWITGIIIKGLSYLSQKFRR